jgi:hypothetical protein
MTHDDDPLADNPPQFDEREEIAAFLRDQGHDPMDISKDGALNGPRISEGNAILHSWEDDAPDERGGRSDFAVMVGWERVEDAANEAGIEIEAPPDVDADLPGWLQHD